MNSMTARLPSACCSMVSIGSRAAPVGLYVFVLKEVIEDLSTATLFKGVTPFWIADLSRLVPLVLLLSLALFLLNSMRGTMPSCAVQATGHCPCRRARP